MHPLAIISNLILARHRDFLKGMSLAHRTMIVQLKISHMNTTAVIYMGVILEDGEKPSLPAPRFEHRALQLKQFYRC